MTLALSSLFEMTTTSSTSSTSSSMSVVHKTAFNSVKQRSVSPPNGIGDDLKNECRSGCTSISAAPSPASLNYDNTTRITNLTKLTTPNKTGIQSAFLG